MVLELCVSLAAGVASGFGTWRWARTHAHPDLVPRTELDLLRDMLRANHDAVLRELSQLRDSVTVLALRNRPR